MYQAKSADASLPLLSFWGSREEDSTQDNDGTGPAAQETTLSSKKTAIIASAAALGAILLGVGAFFSTRLYMRRRAELRRSQQEQEQAVAGAEYMSEHSPDFQSGFRPLSLQSRPRSDPFDDFNQRDSVSQYPVTERHQTEDFYNTAPAATMAGAMGLADNGRPLFDSPPLPDTANPFPHQRGVPEQQQDVSFIDARKSGSGSSVQSAMLHNRRRMSSMDFAPRDTWYKHSSQWDPGHPPPTQQAMIQPVQPAFANRPRESRPYSASSTYSAPHNFGGFASQPGTLRKGKLSVSAPYLQDNSLML